MGWKTTPKWGSAQSPSQRFERGTFEVTVGVVLRRPTVQDTGLIPMAAPTSTSSVTFDSGLPQVFGRYLLVQRLSRGGMGEIFLAKHGLAGFEKLAVIKKVLPHLSQDAQFISRFVDEAQVAIKLQHVNIAQVFEVGRVGDEYFLALEYIEGRDLRRTFSMLAQRAMKMPTDLALYIARELANGLAYAHRRTSNDGSSLNLVHCDISPPNVVVSLEGEIKVIDFGIAKSALRGTATDPKMGFGKFGYMAPEQLIRGGIVDHRTDIYAAGVVLFELLTGVRLYEVGESPDYRALAKAVSKGDHQLPSDVDAALAPFDELVSMCLAPRPSDRYQNAGDVRDAIAAKLAIENPTISTDQLGSFMRELFAEDLVGQKAMNDRIAATHLDDFQREFSTQAVDTISFASSNGESDLGKRRRTTQMPPPLPVAPAAAIQDPSAPYGNQHNIATTDSPLLSSRMRLVAVGAAIALALGGVVYAMIRRSSQSNTSNVAALTTDAALIPQVTPLDPLPADAAPSIAPADAAVLPDAAKVSKPIQRGDKTEPHANKVVSEVSRQEVSDRFKVATKEYSAFKGKYGLRLDSHWNDLLNFFQFKLKADGNDDAMRKIEFFRGRMRAIATEQP
jgi:serine/threonine protein kinase